MSDEADFSSQQEIFDNQLALSRHKQREQEKPYVIGGIKHCVECGDPIPEKRAALLWTVRCIECQELVDWENKNA